MNTEFLKSVQSVFIRVQKIAVFSEQSAKSA
jgi:hypothetical protein